MKNVENMLRQAHDVLYDELNRNVREMTTDESNFIRDCLDDMDTWIQNAERKFGRADASQSRKFVKSSDDDIYSGCHGKSDKRRREKKEDELESSRRLFSSEGSSKTTGETKQEFYENVERDLDCEIYDDDGKFLTIEIDGDFYEAEYTKYMRGDYELMHYNLHKTSSRRDAFDEEDELESSRKGIKSDFDISAGSKFKNQNGSVIEILEVDDDYRYGRDGTYVLYAVNDNDKRDTTVESMKTILEKNGYEPLISSRNAITFSKFNRISSLFIKNDVLKPGKTGIELNINGWKIINKDGKPTGGEAAEFNSEKAAKASEIYRKLADRYGEENVRTFKQD